MKVRSLFLLVVLCFASSASAQDTWQSRSRFSYGQVNIDGESIDATYHHVGRFKYGYYSDGSRSTTSRVGSRSYTDIWTSKRRR